MVYLLNYILFIPYWTKPVSEEYELLYDAVVTA